MISRRELNDSIIYAFVRADKMKVYIGSTTNPSAASGRYSDQRKALEIALALGAPEGSDLIVLETLEKGTTKRKLNRREDELDRTLPLGGTSADEQDAEDFLRKHAPA